MAEHLIADILDWFNGSFRKNPALFVSVILAMAIPGVFAIWWQAHRVGRIKTKFGWVIQRENPVAFRWTMFLLLMLIWGMAVLFVFMTALAVMGRPF